MSLKVLTVFSPRAAINSVIGMFFISFWGIPHSLKLIFEVNAVYEQEMPGVIADAKTVNLLIYR